MNEINIDRKQGEHPNSEIFEIQIGSKNESVNCEKILNVINALANLKDNLKKKMTSLGLNKQLVEDEINQHLCLKLIADLDNQDKHGYPLTQTKRSYKDPLITNINSKVRIYQPTSSVLDKIPTKPDSDTIDANAFMEGLKKESFGITFNFENNTTSVTSGKNTIMVIDADIIDKDNNFIAYFSDIVEDSILIWEMFIVKYKLAVN